MNAKLALGKKPHYNESIWYLRAKRYFKNKIKIFEPFM